MDNLKNSLAFGHDAINAVTVKTAVAVLAPPVTHIINLSLGTQRFPVKWKLGRVLLLLKSSEADKTCPSGFRPVTQLSLISKLAEKCVQVQLLTSMENTGQISQDLHAYWKYLSTTTVLTQAMDEILDAIDENKIAATMSIDQSVAFDCVEHVLLIRKLKLYHIGKDVIDWIISYLEYRSMYVSIDSANSDIIMVKQGVPQGTVLGPLLYLIYTNDFPISIEDDFCENLVRKDMEQLFGSH